MTVKTLIEKLSHYNKNAIVRLHHREGEELLFALAFQNDDTTVVLETDIANEIKFIASLEFGKWRVAIQLPYIRIPLSVQPARTETGVMKNLREYIKNNENALRDFLLVSNKYDEVKKQMLSDFGITSITDVEVNNMKSFGDYIRQFENYVKDKNWLFQSSYSFFSVNKAINHLREEYDRLITKVDSIAM